MITMQEPGDAAQHRRRPAAHARPPARPRPWPPAITRRDRGRWTTPSRPGRPRPARPPTRAPTARCRRARAYPTALRKQELPHGRLPADPDDAELPQQLPGDPHPQGPGHHPVRQRGAALDVHPVARRTAVGAADFRDAIGDLPARPDRRRAHHRRSQSLTLSGRSATIPVTVQNSLAQEVTGLVLRLTSNQPTRLQITAARPADQHRRRPHPLAEVPRPPPAPTAGPGDRPALHRGRHALRQADALPGERHLDHRHRDAGHRRRPAAAGPRRGTDVPAAQAPGAAGRPEPEPDSAGTEAAVPDEAAQDVPVGVDATVPGQPGDPAPDTAAESAEPSATGEKVDR